MERKIIFAYDKVRSTTEKSVWLVSRTELLPGLPPPHMVRWEAGPCGWSGPNRPLYADAFDSNLVLRWNHLTEDTWEYVFHEIPQGGKFGTCWKQSSKLDEVVNSMCMIMELPLGQFHLKEFLLNWLFYPTTEQRLKQAASL